MHEQLILYTNSAMLQLPHRSPMEFHHRMGHISRLLRAPRTKGLCHLELASTPLARMVLTLRVLRLISEKAAAGECPQGCEGERGY